MCAAFNSQPSVPSNQDLISDLLVCNTQHYSTSLVLLPPNPCNADTATSGTINPPTHATISTVAQSYPETNFKLDRILKRCDCPSTYDEGSCLVSILMPNAHISEVILTRSSDMESSSDDLRTELDSHANMVALGSIYFLFESNGRI